MVELLEVRRLIRVFLIQNLFTNKFLSQDHERQVIRMREVSKRRAQESRSRPYFPQVISIVPTPRRTFHVPQLAPPLPPPQYGKFF